MVFPPCVARLARRRLRSSSSGRYLSLREAARPVRRLVCRKLHARWHGRRERHLGGGYHAASARFVGKAQTPRATEDSGDPARPSPWWAARQNARASRASSPGGLTSDLTSGIEVARGRARLPRCENRYRGANSRGARGSAVIKVLDKDSTGT